MFEPGEELEVTEDTEINNSSIYLLARSRVKAVREAQLSCTGWWLVEVEHLKILDPRLDAKVYINQLVVPDFRLRRISPLKLLAEQAE